MKYSLKLADQTIEVLNYFKNDNISVSDDCLELFDIASKFYYHYHIKNMPQFISCARYFVFFDRLIVHLSGKLDKLYPGFSNSINKDGLGYLEKLDIIKNFITDKLNIAIDICKNHS
jgi:hypothetical protein